jgi:hypothetical protein
MALPTTKVPERSGLDPAAFAEVVDSYRPLVLRGINRDWPVVKAGVASPIAVSKYLGSFYNGRPAEVFVAPPEAGGRFFYSDDLTGFNFEKQQAALTKVLEYLVTSGSGEGARSVYIGAASVPDYLPGFEAENRLDLLAGKSVIPRIWIGNKTSVSTHYDQSDNVACVLAGKRRFIVFPPDQVANLYVGPLDHTMAGQPASMVSVQNPDFERYPRFREALRNAMVAELEPGDAIYLPPLWWHQVDALSPFNILLNYWWNDAPADAGSPFEAMVHGLLTISQLPELRRNAWEAMFENFVFQRHGNPAEHLPPGSRGILGEPTPQLRARIKQFLFKALGRH